MNSNTCQLWKNQYLVKSSNICTINNIHSATFRGAGSEATRKYGPKLLSQKRVSPDAFSSSFGLLATQNKLNGLLPINSLKKKSKQKKKLSVIPSHTAKETMPTSRPFPKQNRQNGSHVKKKTKKQRQKSVTNLTTHTKASHTFLYLWSPTYSPKLPPGMYIPAT